MTRTLVAGVAGGLMLVGTAAQANIEWSGFANIGAGFTSGSDEQALGYEDSLSFKPDTLFALQGKAELADDLSITTQLMARGEDNFDLGVEWAYLQYRLNESWTINAGKLRLPFYNYSDSLDVAYSYHWLRTPQDVYRVPFDNFTGVSAQYNTFWGDAMLSTQLVSGNLSDEIEILDTVTDTEINNLVGLNSSLNYHSWTFRGGYFYTNDVNMALQSSELDALRAGLQGLGYLELLEQIEIDGSEGTFASLGLTFDNFDWLLAAEYTELEVDNSFLAKQRSFYVTLGKRFGSWMPHVTYAGSRDKAVNFDFDNVPAPLAMGVTQLSTSSRQWSDSWSLGARYDMRPGVALKFDLSHIDDDAFNRRSNVVSVAIQTVF